jgi:tetratricopeptide (TPR) repeat protein
MMLKAPRYLDEYDAADERSFTNREDAFSLLDDAIEESAAGGYRVLNFYGVGGVGKTRLCKQLGIHLDRRGGGGSEGPLWAIVDFQERDHRDSPSDVLFHMRRELRARYRLDFPTFDIAYAVYWQQLHPQTELTRRELPFLEEGELLTEIVDAVQEVPGVGLLTQIPRFIHRTSRRAQEWWVRRGQRSLARLRELKAFEIERLLPSYWALDLNAQAGERPAVLLLDTYELLRHGHPAEGGATAVDEWVRNWILELPGVAWVIAGREKLAWQDVDPDWAEAVRHYRVDDLAEHHVQAFLRTCGIVRPEVVDAIFRATQGNPFYLNLAADTHDHVAAHRPPRAEDFGATPFELVERFTRGLSDAQLGTLEILAVPNGWDREMFALLVRHFDTGFATQHYPKLVRFSFIQQAAGAERWNMHALMRRTLLEHPRFAEPARVHAFLYEHYRSRLQGVSERATGPVHLEALREAVFHGRGAVPLHELREWFVGAVYAIDFRAHARTLLPLFQDLLKLSGDAGEGETPTGADLYRGLGHCLAHGDRYVQAEAAYREALRIQRAALPVDDPAIAVTHFYLGWMLNNVDRLEEARAHADEAERIYALDHAARAADAGVAVDAFPHEGHSDALRLLGVVSAREFRYARALELYERALALSPPERVVDHANLRLETATALNMLEREPERANALRREAIAVLEERYGVGSIRAVDARSSLVGALQAEDRFREAEALCLECLEIYREAFGEESSQVAAILSSLASVRIAAGAGSGEIATLLESAFSASRTSLGEQHSSTAYLSVRIAGTYDQPELVREKALPLLTQAYETLRTLYGDTHPLTASALADLARAHEKVADLEEADRLMAQAAAHAADPTRYSAATEVSILQRWSDIQLRLMRRRDAEATLWRAVRICEARLPVYRGSLAATLRKLAALYTAESRPADAAPLLARTTVLEEELYGPDDPRVVDTLFHVAAAQRAMGEEMRALATVSRALRIQRARGLETSFRTMDGRVLEAALLGEAGLHDQAVEVMRDVVANLDARFPHLAGYRFKAKVVLASQLAAAGAGDQAERLLEETIADTVAGRTYDLAEAAAAAYEKLLEIGGRTDAALDALLFRGERLVAELEPISTDAAGFVRLYRGEALFRRDRYAEAAEALAAAREHTRAAPRASLRHRVAKMLGWSLGKAGRMDEALPLLRESIEPAREAFGPNSTAEAKVYELLTEIHISRSDGDRARYCAARCLELRRATRGGGDEAAYACALMLDAWARGLDFSVTPEGEAQLQEACEIYSRCPGDVVVRHAQALLRLGEARAVLENRFAAEAAYREVLARFGGRQDTVGYCATALARLGSLIVSQTPCLRVDEAEALLREAERLCAEAGATIQDDAVRSVVEGLVGVAYARKRFAELDAYVVPWLVRAEGTPVAGGTWHQQMLVLAAFARVQLGRLDAAEVVLERLLGFPEIAAMEGAMAIATAALVLKPLLAAGEVARARALFGHMESAAARVPPFIWQSRSTLLVLHARVTAAEGDLDAAESLLDAYLEELAQSRRPATEDGIESVEAVAAARAAGGEHAAAARWYGRALEMRQAACPDQTYDNALAAMNLGVALVGMAAWEPAGEALGKALRGHEGSRAGPTLDEAGRSTLDAGIAEILFNLGRVEYEQGALESARARLERSLALGGELFGMQDARTARAREWLDRVRDALESGTDRIA